MAEDHESQTLEAIHDRKNLKRVPAAEALRIVLAELDSRQERGLLSKKQYAVSSKNAIALKFVDLHALVTSN